MKKLFSTITFLFLSLGLFSQVSKNLIQNFNIIQGTSISLELYGDVVVQNWDNDYIRVEFSVTLENASLFILENLQSAGRYKLLSSNEGGHLHIFNIPTQYRIKVHDIDLKEKFSYRIFVPSFSDNENIQIFFPESKQYNQNTTNQTPVN